MQLNLLELDVFLRDKKDFLLLKVLGLKVVVRQDPGAEKSVTTATLEDLRLIQGEQELVQKHFKNEQLQDMRFSGPQERRKLLTFEDRSDRAKQESQVSIVLGQLFVTVDLKRLIASAQIIKSFVTQINSIVKV